MKSPLNIKVFSLNGLTSFSIGLLIALSCVSVPFEKAEAKIKGVTPVSKQANNNQSKLKQNINQLKTDVDKRLDKLESTVFLETYDKDSQTARLNRLEKEVYSQTNPSLSVNERLASLEKIIVLPIKPSNNEPDDSSNDFNQPVYNPGQDPVLEGSQPAYNQPYSQQQNKPSLPTPAAKSATNRLNELELYIFNKTFPKDTVVTRLNRIEGQVNQGKEQPKGSIDSRIKALSKTVLGDEQQTQPVAGSNYPPNYPPGGITAENPGVDRYGNPYNQPDPPQQPMYNSRNLYLPSENPYQQPYNQTQQPIPQQQGQGMTYADPDNGYNNQNTSSPPPASDPANQADMSAALGNLEHELFKSTYPQEANAARLSRLETRVFKQASPDMPDEDRLERLIAVVAADGDNPKSMSSGGSWKSLLPFLIMIPLMFL